ncbi:UbiD family decarboxylase [Candidatus Aciduliprofundum boonei]|uniref:Anhydromevalonate phosphate decarboxylase n=1 Tax=Aciduliprofundum boonei (strain DSM 19572 / T469) TaxID=439481 RepID=B5I9F5_ACIB4|nr:UbiD family decarboxylase [Candidatus Aciduliprofundum boonei]ADD08576.1 UbiD family decarboxylase [Aciduliprofundum boonei T469]EDY37095.1 3-octaprenyl-4-hydroxybenzoate carboxy-lyase subfamily [Aciduliprofundum boonei T469]HII55655.1 UbiD family decarboxylase [Candidatus Aciduliprofundum boonei]
MLANYIELFGDVVNFKGLSLEEVAEEMKKERKKILYFEDINGYNAVANLWSERWRFEVFFNMHMLPLLLKSIEEPKDYKIVDLDMCSEDFSLLYFPFPKYYPKDGGRYITSAIVYAEYGGKRNASFHRMMLLDEHRAAIRLVPRDLYGMHKDAVEHGEELKIAVTIGNEPNMLLAAATSSEHEELRISSAIKLNALGREEEVMRLPNGILVPYNSEIVLEGRIIDEYVDEGPFVDITGTYDIVRKQPVVVFEKFYHRGNPIFHLLLSGGYEHYNLMGMPREPTIYREIKNKGVDVQDVYLTPGGCSWLHGVVKIRKKDEEDGKKAIEAAFKGHGSLKHVVIVDEDIDIHNMQDVEFAIATRFQGDRDLVIYERVWGSSLDPSSYGKEHLTTKIGIDATAPLGKLDEFKRVS